MCKQVWWEASPQVGSPTQSAIPPPPPGFEPRFQVWGGKSTGWITYDDSVQQELLAAWRAGGSPIEVTIESNQYLISTNPQDMYQDNLGTGAPQRKVRIQPTQVD